MSNLESLNISKTCSSRSCVHLTKEQSIEFGEVLIKFGDIFAKHDNDLGLFTEGEHTIDTGDAQPIKQRMRRTPLCFADEEESYLRKMLDNGVIQPSSSEWPPPLSLFARKTALSIGLLTLELSIR